MTKTEETMLKIHINRGTCGSSSVMDAFLIEVLDRWEKRELHYGDAGLILHRLDAGDFELGCSSNVYPSDLERLEEIAMAEAGYRR